MRDINIIHITILFLSFFVVSSSHSQSLISIDELIQEKMNTRLGNNFSKSKAFLEKGGLNLPLTDGVEFRTETDEWEIGRQEYTVRFKMFSTDERKAQKALTQILYDEYSLEELDSAKDLKEEIYGKMIDFKFDLDQIENLRKELALLQDKKRALDFRMNNGEVINLVQWYNLEDDILDLLLDIKEKELDLAEHKAYFNIQNRDLDWYNFISVENIKSRAEKLKIQEKDINSELAIRKRKAQYEIERAESERLFDFAQLRYRGRSNAFVQNEFSIGTSINLPYGGTNSLQKKEAMLSLIEEREKVEIARRERAEDRAKTYNALINAIELYEEFIGNTQELNLNEKIMELQSSGLVGVEDILDLKLLNLNNQQKSSRMKKEIYGIYRSLLSVSDILYLEIDINHLQSLSKNE